MNSIAKKINTYKYLFLLILGAVGMWFYFGYFYPDLTLLVRVCIVFYIMLYIDEGVRHKLNIEKLKKANKLTENRISSPCINLFGWKVRIRWIYHIFATALFLGVLFFAYDLNLSDHRFHIAALLLIGLTFFLEVVSYLFETVNWSKKRNGLL